MQAAESEKKKMHHAALKKVRLKRHKNKKQLCKILDRKASNST